MHWIGNFVDLPSFFKNIQKPIVWTLHDENLFSGIFHYNPGKYKDEPLEKKYYQIKKDAVKSAERLGFVFLSKMMYDQYHDDPMIEGKPAVVINNPVNCEDFKPVDKLKARSKFGIPADKTIFAFVTGTIANPRKGLKILSETLQRMNIRNTWILAVGGKKGYEPLPLVYTTDEIRDPKKLSEAYSCADYFVMPSMQEAFGLTPLEAMACGILAVVFPVSGTEELITPQNGVIAKGFTSEDLEKAIRQAMATEYDGTAIRQDIIDRFSPSAIANKYVAFYKKIQEG